MLFWELILLSIVQGLTEFLPISSSGHLVLFYNIFGIEDNVKLLSILLHIATLMSVLIYYRKEIILLVKKPFCKTNRKIFITTLCTCLVVVVVKPWIDKSFDGKYLFVFFLITAILLFVSDFLSEKQQLESRINNNQSSNVVLIDNNITDMPIGYKQAILIGLTQGIACFPGISRSGSTIAVGRMCGVSDSARYSFLISIPIIIASFVMEIMEGGTSVVKINIFVLLIVMVICMAVGLLCIKFMTKMVNKNKLTYFSYYLIFISILLIFFGL